MPGYHTKPTQTAAGKRAKAAKSKLKTNKPKQVKSAY